MTDRGGRFAATDREDQDSDLYATAADDLDALRELLRSAGRGEADLAQLETALRDYWREDGPTIRRAGAAALELVRLQALAQLYGWREQLAGQLRQE